MMLLQFFTKILIHLLLNCVSCTKAETYPKILEFDSFTWKNIALLNGSQRGYIVDTFYAGESTDLQCNATFPVQWNSTGFISVSDKKIYGPTVDIVNSKFRILQTFEKLREASLRVACEMVGNPEIFDEIFLFLRSRSNKLLVSANNQSVISVEDSNIIPCATFDPTVVVELYYLNSYGDEKLVREDDPSLQYHPVEGFRTKDKFNGTYVCRQNESLVKINAKLTTQDDYYSPKVDLVKVFDEETILLECQSNSAEIVEIFVNQSDATFLSTNLDHYNRSGHFNSVPVIPKYQKLNPNISIYTLNITNDTESHSNMVKTLLSCELNELGIASIKLKASCIKTGENIIVKEWAIQFVKTPKLLLNYYARQMQCGAPGEKIEAKSINCRNSMECRFMRSHIEKNVVKVTIEKEESENVRLVYALGEKRKCEDVEPRYRFGCVSVPYDHVNGLVRCGVDGLEKEWEFFESLDHQRYTDWTLAPTKQILRMDEVPLALYTNKTSNFVCEAVKFLFSSRIVFQIEFKNKTVVYLEDNESYPYRYRGHINNKTVQIHIDALSDRYRKDVNVIGFLDIKLPIDAVGIHCTGFLWNTSEGITASRKFETRHLMKPYVLGSPQNDITFYIGESNRRLTCPAKGEPELYYTWSYNNMSLSNKFPEIKMGLSVSGGSNIEFPLIDELARSKYTGVYRCQATNELGTVECLFRVKILEKPDGKTAIYISTAVVGVLVFSFIIALMIRFMRKYRNAKFLLRNLTDTELQEFFDGRPDLVGNRTNVETVEFLPYNKHFEIAFDDLEFDLSENQILGSGEFGFVVRGLIVSRQMSVALKISKSSTDVTMFKSLLSEIKIMAYIGTHENVIGLVGVCTENIRTRSIYIAIEICELGSLKNYLQKSKSSFVDLQNANQQIDVKMYDNISLEQKLTTTDLIKFSAHIAKGMEYLAYKSVIHADLATRNVLVSVNKIAKISDFGLSKRLYESTNYVKKSRTPLPWRWMAIESLNSLTFSTMSDVWAYGVTLYEIFTLGDAPFPNENWSHEFVARLEDGMRMGRPRYSTPEIYSKIVACWEKEPELRPTFTALRIFFEQLDVECSQLTTGNAEATESKLQSFPSVSHEKQGNEERSVPGTYENSYVNHPLEHIPV